MAERSPKVTYDLVDLHGRGGGFRGKAMSGIGGSMGDGGGAVPPTKDYVDAQDEKTRAQNDARFAELAAAVRGTEMALITKMGEMQNSLWRSMWSAAAVTVATIIGLFIAIMAFGGDMFDSGFSTGRDLGKFLAAQQEREEVQRDRDAAQDAKFDELFRILTERLPPPNEAPDPAQPPE